MFFHASPVGDIDVLTPHVSNHGRALTYFSTKRENTLVYLSNAVEKFCREQGIYQEGPFHKWATYGFDCAGLLVLDEYYPNALRETYQGVSGYIYTVEQLGKWEWQKDIPGGAVTEENANVIGCEYVPDAYIAIMEAAEQGKIIVRNFEEHPERFMKWVRQMVKTEYIQAEADPGYRAFLRDKFDFCK